MPRSPRHLDSDTAGKLSIGCWGVRTEHRCRGCKSRCLQGHKSSVLGAFYRRRHARLHINTLKRPSLTQEARTLPFLETGPSGSGFICLLSVEPKVQRNTLYHETRKAHDGCGRLRGQRGPHGKRWRQWQAGGHMCRPRRTAIMRLRLMLARWEQAPKGRWTQVFV